MSEFELRLARLSALARYAQCMEQTRRDLDQRPSLDWLKINLSDERAREFQQLLKEERGLETTLEEAREIAERIIRLYRLLVDPNGVEAAVRRVSSEQLDYPTEPRRVFEPPLPPEPEPRPCPILRDADHAKEVHFNLAMVRDELRFVRRRPAHWRWALVALYDALGHALALHCPPEQWPEEGLGQLTRLFDVVATTQPEILPAREAVETVDRIRTNFLRYAVNRWPVSTIALTGVVNGLLHVIARLKLTGDEGSRDCRSLSETDQHSCLP